MSLLNNMLRDLDARHAPSVDRAALPEAVHVLPAPRGVPWWAIALALVAVAALAWLAVGRWNPPAAPAPLAAPQRVPAPAPAPVAATAAATPPVATPPVATAPAAAPTPAAAGSSPGKPDRHSGPKAAATSATPGSAANDVAKPKAAAAGLKLDTRLASGANKGRESTALPATAPAPAEPAAGIEKRPRSALAGDAAEAEYAKALGALRRGSTSGAIEDLRTTLRLNSRHAPARQTLLALLVEQQQWSEAEALLEEGLALDAAQTGWALALARLQLENGKFANAVDTLARHAPYAEQNADYQAFRALLSQKQKRLGEAADFYRAALALKPAESRWWYGLGLALEGAQKPQEAREAYLKAKETGNLPQELVTAVDARLR